MNLAKFSVRNNVLVNILMAAILILGGYYYSIMPRELITDISFNWMFAVTVYPGAGPEEIEKSVAKPLEEAISKVDDIEEIVSQSKDGYCFMEIKFEENLSRDDFLRRQQELRTEVANADLPDDCEDPDIEEFSTSDFIPILSVILSGDVSEEILNESAEYLHDEIIDINGVSKVEIVGAREKEVTVEVDRLKTEAMGITLADIVNAVRGRQLDIPGGILKQKSGNYAVRTVGEASRIEDIRNMVIKSFGGGRKVKLHEVAKISDG
ncbi:MAG: efflux RND transporter permease subunit, partial [Fibrobacterota bacterium]